MRLHFGFVGLVCCIQAVLVASDHEFDLRAFGGADNQACTPDSFGGNCNIFCDRYDTCSGNGRCRGKNGVCICDEGWAGEDCSIPEAWINCEEGFGGAGCETCQGDMFTGACNTQCDRYETCSGNGRCRGLTGGCICDEGWAGEDCSIPEAWINCEEGFGGAGCEACQGDMFTGACNTTCDRYETCSGNGRCRGLTGGCICDEGWAGEDCSVPEAWIGCEEGFGGAGCEACLSDMFNGACNTTCDRYETCSGNGRCRGLTGGCICDEGWAGEDCSIPEAWVNCEEGFGGAGCEACLSDMFTGSCDVTCDRYETCSGNGRCRGLTGGCICDEGWFGRDCSSLTPVPEDIETPGPPTDQPSSTPEPEVELPTSSAPTLPDQTSPQDTDGPDATTPSQTTHQVPVAQTPPPSSSEPLDPPQTPPPSSSNPAEPTASTPILPSSEPADPPQTTPRPSSSEPADPPQTTPPSSSEPAEPSGSTPAGPPATAPNPDGPPSSTPRPDPPLQTTPEPEPDAPLSTVSGGPCDGSCSLCVSKPNNPQNVRDEQCALCGAGSTVTWWPCDDPRLCQCAGRPAGPPTTATELEPEVEVTPAPPGGGGGAAVCGATLAAASECDLWVKEDLSVGTGSIEGRVCVGGDMTVGAGFSIGTGLPGYCEQGEFAVVVGGDMRWESGRTYTAGHCVGGAAWVPAGVTPCSNDRARDAGGCADVIDFEGDYQRLTWLSDQLAAGPVGFQRSTAKIFDQVITAVVDATASKLHLVTCDASLWAGWDAWAFTVVASSGSLADIDLVVVSFTNVPGGEIGFVMGKQFINIDAALGRKLLFNYAGSHTIGLGAGPTFPGSLLAPRAVLSATSAGSWRGQVIVKSYATAPGAAANTMHTNRLMANTVCVEESLGLNLEAAQELALEGSQVGQAGSASGKEEDGSPGAELWMVLLAGVVAAVLCGGMVVTLARRCGADDEAEQIQHAKNEVGGLFMKHHRVGADHVGEERFGGDVEANVMALPGSRRTSGRAQSGIGNVLRKASAMMTPTARQQERVLQYGEFRDADGDGDGDGAPQRTPSGFISVAVDQIRRASGLVPRTPTRRWAGTPLGRDSGEGGVTLTRDRSGVADA